MTKKEYTCHCNYGYEHCHSKNHECICEIEPDECRADNHVCICDDDPDECQADDHECICDDDPNECQADKHECICNSGRAKKCRLEPYYSDKKGRDMYHLCTCSINVEYCKAKKHNCTCEKSPKKCKNQRPSCHNCICASNPDNCRRVFQMRDMYTGKVRNSSNHICICRKYPGKCKRIAYKIHQIYGASVKIRHECTCDVDMKTCMRRTYKKTCSYYKPQKVYFNEPKPKYSLWMTGKCNTQKKQILISIFN